MDYEFEKQAILSETDFARLDERLERYAGHAAAAARRSDDTMMHVFVRLAHWTLFREASFRWKELDMPILDEHTHAIVGDTTVEAFAAAVETEPPPMTFDEAMTLARASRGN
ncbi:MAG TPA: hypothetical protein VGX71_05395 [Pseudaminobacter sp.]|nr:hypothetical protein [Pseudaminobacter sp.]